MKTIQVYDPPMCCSTGLCGTEIDPALISFAAMLTELRKQGVSVERYNLGQQPMAFVQNPLQLGILRFLLGAADGALLPAVQTLLIYNCTNQVAGRVFSYNQSFRDVGNVTGPLLGATVSASYGFRAVFCVTACVVLFNAFYSYWCLQRRPSQSLVE